MKRRLKMIVIKRHEHHNPHEYRDEHDGSYHHDEHDGSYHHNEHSRDHHHEKKYRLPYETEANNLMSDEFENYVKKHGYHFTESLAEYVSKMMKNANGQEHSWTAAQVKKAMEGLGLMPIGVTETKATLGDVTYLANMYYADLYPESLKDEASCLKVAHRIAHDRDGYDGMIFCRWTADAIGKAIDIDWKKFT